MKTPQEELAEQISKRLEEALLQSWDRPREDMTPPNYILAHLRVVTREMVQIIAEKLADDNQRSRN